MNEPINKSPPMSIGLIQALLLAEKRPKYYKNCIISYILAFGRRQRDDLSSTSAAFTGIADLSHQVTEQAVASKFVFLKLRNEFIKIMLYRTQCVNEWLVVR